MLATLRPSIKSMEEEFYQSAPRGAILTTFFVEGAREASDSGNIGRHNHLIAKAIKPLSDFDAVMLDHLSMLPALEMCQSVIETPTLTAPDTAVNKIKEYNFKQPG